MKQSLFALMLGCAAVAMTSAHAQTYPAKPIRFLVGFPPAGTNDIVARAVAQKVTELVGQSIAVENRGGANTAIATELGARAAPDGYTILLNAPGHATNPALMKLGFDPIKDFAFITLLAEAPAKTPRPIIEKLNAEFVRAIKSPDLRDRLVAQGADPVGNTPEQYAAFVQNEIGKWARVIKAAGIKAE